MKRKHLRAGAQTRQVRKRNYLIVKRGYAALTRLALEKDLRYVDAVAPLEARKWYRLTADPQEFSQ